MRDFRCFLRSDHRLPLSLFCALALAATMPADAEGLVGLRISLHSSSISEAISGVVALDPVGGTGDAEEARKQIEIGDEGRAIVDLEPGSVWRVSVLSEELWSSSRVVTVGQEPTAVALMAWPAAFLTGAIVVPHDHEPPKKVSLRFAPSPDERAAIPRSTARCHVKSALSGKALFRCKVPAVELDLAVRARGFSSRYFWDRLFHPGSSENLGIVKLVPGASVAGWIAPSEAEVDFSRARVEMEPRVVGDRAAPQLEREKLLRRRVEINDRGFFHFDGVAEGSYLVTVRHPDFAPARISPVTVLAGAETEIQSVELRKPLRLSAELKPPRDPFLRPWRLRLSRRGLIAGSADVVAETEVSSEGQWQCGGLEPGEYSLTVLDSRGSHWSHEALTLVDSSTAHEITIPFVRVEGRVSLHDEPVAAVLWFGGKHAAERIRVRSDAEGKFYVFLPPRKTWEVDVEAKARGIFSHFPKVRTVKRAGEPWAKLELSLPGGSVTGQVVDENGEPVPGAVVRVTGETVRRSLTASAEVSRPAGFRAEGLELGQWRLEAESSGGTRARSSESVPIELSEENPRGEVRLVLRDQMKISGIVVAPTGEGVVGARILAHVEQFPLFLTSRVFDVITNVDGAFSLDVPSSARYLLLSVFPPGFAARQLRVSVQRDEPLIVPVDPLGGRLVLVFSEGTDPDELFVFHDFLFSYPPVLRAWAETHGIRQEQSGEIIIPMLEPGAYRVCQAPGPEAVLGGRVPIDENRCSGGELAPYGELRLTIGASGEEIEIPEKAASF